MAEGEVVSEEPGKSIPDGGLTLFTVGAFGDVHVAAWLAQTRHSAEWVQYPRMYYTLQQRKQSPSIKVHLLSSEYQPVYSPAFLSVYNTAMLGPSRYVQGGSSTVRPQRECPPPLLCWSGASVRNLVFRDLPELIASRLLYVLLTDYPRRERLCQEKHVKMPRE